MQLLNAAIARERVRVQGRGAELGDGCSGTYRNVWLRIGTAVGSVRVTASTNSTLGTIREGSDVELAATMTALVDVAENVYYGQRARPSTSGVNVWPANATELRDLFGRVRLEVERSAAGRSAGAGRGVDISAVLLAPWVVCLGPADRGSADRPMSGAGRASVSRSAPTRTVVCHAAERERG